MKCVTTVWFQPCALKVVKWNQMDGVVMVVQVRWWLWESFDK